MAVLCVCVHRNRKMTQFCNGDFSPVKIYQGVGQGLLMSHLADTAVRGGGVNQCLVVVCQSMVNGLLGLLHMSICQYDNMSICQYVNINSVCSGISNTLPLDVH